MNIDSFRPMLLKAGIARHNADWNWKNVYSPFFRIYYVTDGNASIQVDGKTYQLEHNKIYVIPAFTLHSTFCSEQFAHYYIHLYEDNTLNNSLFAEYDIPVCIEGNEQTRRLFERIVELNPELSLAESNPLTYDNSEGLQLSILHNRQRSFRTQLETRSLMYLIILELLKHSQKREMNHDARITKVLELIARNPSTNYTTTELASIACLSTEHFIRLFRKTVRYTPIQYVNNKRMERAQILLATSNISVNQIAAKLGFHDVSYFVKSFKKLTGMTPAKYKSEIGRQ